MGSASKLNQSLGDFREMGKGATKRERKKKRKNRSNDGYYEKKIKQ